MEKGPSGDIYAAGKARPKGKAGAAPAPDGGAAPPRISVVIPVFNESGNVHALHDAVTRELEKLGRTYELVYVDDGSRDQTLKLLKEIAAKEPRVTILTFRRNFGKANALSAGFFEVQGDVVFTMDGDLQDDPKEFKKFLDKLEEGYDVVSGWKFKRLDPLGKRLPSKVFNGLIGWMTGVRIHDNNCGFKAYRREVVKTVDVYGEFHRYIPVLAHWRGFRVAEIKVTHHKRVSGKSKYGLERLFRGLMDLLTISLLYKYGRSPMYLFGSLGLVSFLFGLEGAGFVIADKIVNGHPLERPVSVAAIFLFLTSMFCILMGFLAELMLASGAAKAVARSYYDKIKGG